MARVPKEIFTQFQDHLNSEQELREVSSFNPKSASNLIAQIEVRIAFKEFFFTFLKEIRGIMKEVDVVVRDATLALQVIHTSLTGGIKIMVIFVTCMSQK